jgi:mRNA deadenylase 3'-5' endonuclease subunit Ccr4
VPEKDDKPPMSGASGGGGLLQRVFHAVCDASPDLRGPTDIRELVRGNPTLWALLRQKPRPEAVVAAAIDRFSNVTGAIQVQNSGFGPVELVFPPALTPDRRYVKPAPFHLRMRKTVEWYFDASNWERDLYLQRVSRRHVPVRDPADDSNDDNPSRNGAVPVATLLQFRKVRNLLNYRQAKAKTAASPADDENLLIEACDQSLVVAVVQAHENGDTEERPTILALRRRSLQERVALLFTQLLSSKGVAANPFLIQMLGERDDGLIPLGSLLRLPVVRSVCSPQEREIAQVLRESSGIEVVQDTAGRFFLRMPEQRHFLSSTATSAAIPKVQFPDLGEIRTRTQMNTVERPGTDSTTPSFTLMSLNVLAQLYTPYHTYAPVEFLEYSYRKNLILSQVDLHAPDILCLQELQGRQWKGASGAGPREHHDMARDMLHDLKERGFYNSYARCSSTKDVDLGNCLLWRTSKFRKMSSRTVALGDEARKRVGEHPASVEHFVHKQMALIVRLTHIETGRDVLACTTHIACAYEHVEIQLVQVMILLQFLWTASESGAIPVVFAGDFNALPFAEVYTLITQGQLDDADVQTGIPQDVRMPSLRRDPDTGFLDHSLNLSSAYSVLGGEPSTTNKTPTFSGCLDYIFFSADKLIARSVRVPPDASVLAQEGGGIPNSVFASDHVPIFGEFGFVEGDEKLCQRCGKSMRPSLSSSADVVLVEGGQEAHAACV